MKHAQLVAIGVAQVSPVQLAAGAFAPAGRVFAGHAAVGHARCVAGIGLLGRLRQKADGAAVAMGGGLTVDGGGDTEGAGGAAVEVAVLVGNACGHAQGAEHGVVKLLSQSARSTRVRR